MCRRKVQDDNEEFRIADVMQYKQTPPEDVAVVRPCDVIPKDDNVVLADFYGCAILGKDYIDIYKGDGANTLKPKIL